jgi:hypothetical protein
VPAALPPPPPEAATVVDDHFRAEVLKTALLQSAFMRRRLAEAGASEKQKAERDVLRLWQLVYDAEEEEACLGDKHAAVTAIVSTHCALEALVGGHKSFVLPCFALLCFVYGIVITIYRLLIND